MPDPNIKVDAPSPSVMFQGEHDEPVALSDLWADAERGVVLAFLRHYG